MAVEDQGQDPATRLENPMDAPADTSVADTGSESSSAPSKDEGEKFDLLSVVRSAVADKSEGPASPAAQEEGSDQQPADQPSEDQPKTADDENFSDVPFHAHPRFKQLVAQRNQFREGAQQYEKVQTFLADNGVTADEAADFLVVRALMKHNPTEAWKQLKPLVQRLLVDAGEVLPPDLKQRVQQGEMTQAAATELSRLRAAQEAGRRAQNVEAEQSQKRQQAEHVRSIQQSVATWEQVTRQRDPDFDAKSEALQKEILWLQKRDGMPKSPEDARKMVETAYGTVNKTLQRPVKQQVRPVTGGRVASGQPTAAPKSILDVVRSARSSG